MKPCYNWCLLFWTDISSRYRSQTRVTAILVVPGAIPNYVTENQNHSVFFDVSACCVQRWAVLFLLAPWVKIIFKFTFTVRICFQLAPPILRHPPLPPPSLTPSNRLLLINSPALGAVYLSLTLPAVDKMTYTLQSRVICLLRPSPTCAAVQTSDVPSINEWVFVSSWVCVGIYACICFCLMTDIRLWGFCSIRYTRNDPFFPSRPRHKFLDKFPSPEVWISHFRSSNSQIKWRQNESSQNVVFKWSFLNPGWVFIDLFQKKILKIGPLR